MVLEVLEVGEGTGVSSFPSYILAGTCWQVQIESEKVWHQ